MQKDLKKITLQLEGLTCVACEKKIEQKLKSTPGIASVQVSFVTNHLDVTYDASHISIERIQEIVERLHYQVLSTKTGSDKSKLWKNYLETAAILLLLLLAYLLIDQTVGFTFVPQLDQSIGMLSLFIIGLFTSLHCVAMCGGITLSICMGGNSSENYQEQKGSNLKTLIFYHSGRLLSYTVIGGIVGGVGAVFSLSYAGKATIQMIAGIFMILMGLQLLLQSPVLRKWLPHMPKFFARKIFEQKTGRGPFVLGLLQGLMPCGPLSAMQVYALGTGSIFLGATSMFLFTLGTIPLLFMFGVFSGFLKNKRNQFLLKVSAALVLLLGISMIQRSLIFTEGTKNLQAAEIVEEKETEVLVEETQEIESTISSRDYEDITVKAGIPVKWTIVADKEDINGCNNVLVIPAYHIQLQILPGENVIEFTPEEEGVIGYSCWMGMIRNSITVVKN